MSHHAGKLKKNLNLMAEIFFAFIKKLKPLIIPMLAMWECMSHHAGN